MKDIHGFEGLYAVTKGGEVWGHKKSHYLKYATSLKYRYVILFKNNIPHTKRIHRLVAETYIPNNKNLPQVNHKNGNSLDNRFENLEWCTAKENVDHATRLGLRPQGHRGNVKLSEKVVSEILKEHARGIKSARLAEKYFVTDSNICCVVNRKTWRNVVAAN